MSFEEKEATVMREIKLCHKVSFKTTEDQELVTQWLADKDISVNAATEALLSDFDGIFILKRRRQSGTFLGGKR